MQYTEDFKRGIVRTLLASGMTRKEFAAKTKITVQALRKWVKQYKDEEIKNVDHNNRSKYSEEYKKSIVSKMLFDGITIPRYLKEEIGNELDEDLTATSPTVSRTLDSYMKRMLDTEEHTTEDYGWLEPSGKFHAVEWGEHQKWAYEYLKRSSTEEKMPVLYEAGDVLTKKGWVLLHNPAQGVAMATINPRRDYTKAQKEFLFSYYMERNCEKEANEIWRE